MVRPSWVSVVGPGPATTAAQAVDMRVKPSIPDVRSPAACPGMPGPGNRGQAGEPPAGIDLTKPLVRRARSAVQRSRVSVTASGELTQASYV